MMSVHAAMSFSRSNFPNSGNSAGEGGVSPHAKPNDGVGRVASAHADHSTSLPRQNADVVAADAIEGRSDMPGWQNAFVLGPNVRFTRTPESAFSRRGAVEPQQDEADIVPAEIEVETVESVIAIPVAEAVAPVYKKPEPRVPQPPRIPVLPQPPHAQGARALTYKLRRELALKQQAEQSTVMENVTAAVAIADVTEVAPVVPVQDLPTDEAVSPTMVLPAFAANLPDEIFFEVMDLDLAPVPGVVPNRGLLTISHPMPLPASAPAIELSTEPPVITVPGGSAVRLYREIGVRAAASSMLPLGNASPVEVEINAPTPETAIACEPPPPVEPRFVARAPIQASQPMFRDAPVFAEGEYEYPSIELLQQARVQQTTTMTPEALEQSAGLLESVLEDFGVKGEIIDVRPGPVVTLYEFEPAPGVKSSRVIGLSDDIARSMSALSARVAVVPGRNVIGIELPNPVRETVYLRELIESGDYSETRQKLALCLGKTIGGEPVIAELAKMPHLLVAGTTGSGKSVAINTMILSILYRLKPEECRLIMVDPKMLELSVYDGIPHLLTPVVTDPKKAVMALKWAVREMEDRYRKMSRLGVRNIDGYNARAATARAKGETVFCNVQTGFDRATGEAVYEQEEMDLSAMPYIVVIVDEMADLMMVAGKEIEGAIQRLAQMARAAGIHLIMATQRPSVDVITGTIKANFPTRISFQVTSKIDSRTILGEQGAEHLLGQGDMLHMMGGGRIARVHGPFVSDEEVEKVVAHLKTQGRPEYLGTVTEDAEEAEDEAEDDSAVFDKTSMAEDDTDDLYEKAVKVVLRDKKCSTSYIQRRLSIGYNRAASLVERMEQEGIVGPANHVGKRSIIAGERDTYEAMGSDG